MITFIPEKLDELVGLDYLKKSLKNIDYSSPIMFVGERGCGKTVLSHILASNFGASPENIRDVNCGNYRKIDDTRKEIDNLKRSSFFGNKRVLILDEVHMLTKEAQSPWLRELDPDNLKSNVLVLACTTTIGKLLLTFQRRFLQYQVKPLSDKESGVLINKICEKNNIELSKMLRVLIIEKCEGVPGLILNGVKKLVGINDLDEASYLLELANIEENEELFEFFKILISKATWGSIKKRLQLLLKTNEPNAIRVGLLNLIGGKLMSDYFDDKRNDRLLNLYQNLKIGGYPEKSNLIFSIYESLVM